jgi:hypothetical protein
LGHGLSSPADLLDGVEDDEFCVKVRRQVGDEVDTLAVVERTAEDRHEELPGMGEQAEMDHTHDDQRTV